MMTSSSFPSQANQLVIRPGRVSDCCDLAELINVSAEGAVDYLFSELRTVESSMQAMSRLLKREVYYSYVNTLVAEMRGELVGMALSFPQVHRGSPVLGSGGSSPVPAVLPWVTSTHARMGRDLSTVAQAVQLPN